MVTLKLEYISPTAGAARGTIGGENRPPCSQRQRSLGTSLSHNITTLGRWETSSNVGTLGTGGAQTFLCYDLPLNLVWLSFDFPAQALTDLRGWGAHQAETSTRSQEIFVSPARRCLHGRRENAPSPSSTLYQQEVHSRSAWSWCNWLHQLTLPPLPQHPASCLTF